MVLFGFPPRICTCNPSAFLLWAVAASVTLRSFALRPAPPYLFPPHISRTRCSVALNFLTTSSNLPLNTLTCPACCLSCFTTQCRTWAVTPKKEQTPTPFSQAAKPRGRRGVASQILEPSHGLLTGDCSLGLSGYPMGG